MGAKGGAERHFLGWDGPPLERAADWLVAHALGEGLPPIVAVPGARAGRRLAELLARRTDPGAEPPRVVTQGQLVDELVRLERPLAGRLVRTLAWERALAGLRPTELDALARRVAGSDGLSARLRLAETVRTLHAELAAEGLDFERLAREETGDSSRWRVLAGVQRDWRRRLDELGLEDPHEGRSTAIEFGRVDRERRVVLVGVADMNHLLHRLLESVAERVTALVVAPEELARGFDPFGRLVTAFWAQRDVPLPLERWHVAEKPVDQADRAMAVLASWDGRFAAEEVSIGLADPEVAPYLEQRLAAAGVEARDAAGLELARTRPFRLLAAAGRYVERRAFGALAALVRHPDLERALREPIEGRDPVAALDRYHRKHLPGHAPGPGGGAGDAPVAWVEDEKRTPDVRALHAALERVLGELGDGRQRPIGAWAKPIRRFLARAYRRPLDPELEQERVLAEALAILGEALGELEELPEALAPTPVAAAEAVELLARPLASRAVPPRPADPSRPTVELLGWLDLALDDAPALVVTGFDEGRIPRSLQGDPFLPNGARVALGLPTDADRLARDAYAATVLLETRAEVAFVTGRRSADGDPLVPSRLAFHAPAREVVERVRHFLPSEDEERGHGAPAVLDAIERAGEGELPRREVERPEAFSVSSFRTYLQSPYLFYLQRVLKLRTVDDRARELDPLEFGSFAHKILERFGGSEFADSTDADAIGDWLADETARQVRARFGTQPLPAVVLQAEQLEYRLRLFARAQAQWAREGWRIERVEWEPPGDAARFDVDGESVVLRGKVDRIDRHPKLGLAILDYKTGDKANEPRKAHLRGDQWRDLQLPLYRWLVRQSGFEGPWTVGYVNLGKDAAGVGFSTEPGWPASELDEGVEVAREIVRAVRRGELYEPRAPKLFDPILEAIFGRGLIAAGAGEGEE